MDARNMIARLNPDEILGRAAEAKRRSSPCTLCPRQCKVDRVAGETGFCGAGTYPSIAAALPHFGEEPPLTGPGGAGTIFFSGCNLRCTYCQNHQISQGMLGSAVAPGDLAGRILELQAQGCSTIEPVSPTHHLPGLLEALAIARKGGLDLPVVYNTNAYESRGTLHLLHGIVDVYLPDLKYASDDIAHRCSAVGDYVQTARDAIIEMHAQVGNLVVDLKGLAVRGLILRHLLLPNSLSGTEETLLWVRDNLPRTITLSLMAQYSPQHRSHGFSPLNRRITQEEYEAAVDLAWRIGLENTFVQELASQDCGVPDFQLENPFNRD